MVATRTGIGGVEGQKCRYYSKRFVVDFAGGDLKPTAANVTPIDLRVFLTVDGQPLSETWLYQWMPPASAERGF